MTGYNSHEGGAEEITGLGENSLFKAPRTLTKEEILAKHPQTKPQTKPVRHGLSINVGGPKPAPH